MSRAGPLSLAASLTLVAATLVTATSQAADPLPSADAAALLQRMADAARRGAYEGTFVFQHGDAMQTLFVANRPSSGASKSGQLKAMDGIPREIRCADGASLSVVAEAGQMRVERRLNNRYFPDLLPLNASRLAEWYAVKPGEMSRVAGLDCRLVELAPKDAYRWGYVLCAEKDTGLPLKAVMVNPAGQTLMQYTFADIKLGGAPKMDNITMTAMPEPAQGPVLGTISLKGLPPGYTRVTAVRRTLPNRPGEVEHWVFSDGLTYISLFLEPANKPVEGSNGLVNAQSNAQPKGQIKGQSKQGMINMLSRQIGNLQATVLGDAPWPAVEAIAMSLEARR